MPHATAEREWAFGEALVEQYARNTRFFHASYCRQLDGIPDLPSPLLANFTASDWPAAPAIPDHWASYSALGQLEPFEDSKAPPLDLRRQSDISGGSGLLEDQSQCPFRAFARRRLRVQPLSEFTVALSAADRGTLLHNALFALWGEVVDQSTLLTLDKQAEGDIVERSVRAAIDSASPRLRRGLGAAYWRLEGQRLVTLLHEWLAVERERSSFVVLAREEELTLELCQLEIRLRVDRIDELADGERVIIDYKSGSSSVQHWLGERPQKPQLLLYGIAAPDSTAALAFAQVRARDCCYVGLGEVAAAKGIKTDIPKALKSRMDAQDWSTLNERWRENLQRIAQSFVDGEAQVDPLSPASCTWCGLQALCRVALAGSMEEGAEA
jgi:ATP-dependent helicase/nuclease subunit B